MKAAKNVQQEVFTEKSNGKTGGETGLDDFIIPELEELIFTAVARHRASSLRETRNSENVFAIILL